MKVTLNLASRRNAAQQVAALLARPLVPLLALGLLCLLIGQGMAWQRQQALKRQLAELDNAVRSQKALVPRKLSAKDYERQVTAITFVNGLAAKDRFSWIALLGRLETTLSQGVTLTQIAPNYGQRSLQLTGLAEDIEALRGYLGNLLNSDSLSAAYLLQQENCKVKDRFGREHHALSFRIEIQEAF